MQIRSENGEDLDLMDFLQEYAREPLPDQAAHGIQINRWLNHVDRAIQACGSLEALHQRLCNDGIQIGIETVRQWIRYRGIFPKINRAIAPLVAKISRPDHCEEEIRAIIHSQKQLQNHHKRIGRAIRRLAMETNAPTPATSGGNTNAPMNEVLASLISFEEVVSVHHHAKNGVAAVQPASLVELVEQMVATSRGRLAITSAGLRSAQNSPYRDFGKVRRCLEILREKYFHVYGPDKSLQLGAAIAAGRPYQIDFKGDTGTRWSTLENTLGSGTPGPRNGVSACTFTGTRQTGRSSFIMPDVISRPVQTRQPDWAFGIFLTSDISISKPLILFGPNRNRALHSVST